MIVHGISNHSYVCRCNIGRKGNERTRKGQWKGTDRKLPYEYTAIKHGNETYTIGDFLIKTPFLSGLPSGTIDYRRGDELGKLDRQMDGMSSHHLPTVQELALRARQTCPPVDQCRYGCPMGINDVFSMYIYI